MLVTGLALIILPLVGLGLKMFSFGWLMVILIMGPVVVLLAGYIMQIVIAVQGFLSKKPLFAVQNKNAITAAWGTSIGIALLGFFMPDGGDAEMGSTFQIWLNAIFAPGTSDLIAPTTTINNVLASFVAAVWVIGYIWLFVLWIKARAAKRRSLRA